MTHLSGADLPGPELGSPALGSTATALLASGLEAYARAAFEQALEQLTQAEEQARAQAAWSLQAQACVAQGRIYRDLGEPERALERLDRALELARQASDVTTEGDALNQRAGVHHLSGEYARALKDLGRALQMARHSDDELRAANCLINIGILTTKLGDYPRALNALTEAYTLAYEHLQDSATQTRALINLGLLYESMGDDARALHTCQLALSTLRAAAETGPGNPTLEAIITVNLGYAHKRLGQLADASARFEQALTLALASGQVKVEIAALDGLGQVRAALGLTSQAQANHRAALGRARETGDVESEMDALLNLGRAALAADQPLQATGPLGQALRAAERAGRRRTVFEAHQLLAETADRLGNPALALIHFREFHRVEKLLFNEEGQQQTRQLSIQFDLERAQHEAEVYRLRTELEREAKEQAEATVQQRTHELQLGRDIIEQQRAQLQDKVVSLHQLLDQNEVLRQRLLLAATRSSALNEQFLRRLSAELHDGPAQDLGFALLKLGSMEPDPATLTPGNGAKSDLEGVHGAIQRAMLEIRAISGGMCLPELEHLTLAETLQRVVQSHKRRTRSEVRLLCETAEQEAPLPIKMTVYRLAQESLNNAFKHAGGQGQLVQLSSERGHLLLTISDQGPGFQTAGVFEQAERLGLLGMRERVESLGGAFQLDTAPGRGTRVLARLPLPAGVETRSD